MRKNKSVKLYEGGTVALAVLLVVALITGFQAKKKNEPTGFRGLKWGDPPTEDMVFSHKIEVPFSLFAGAKVYTRPDEKKQVGDIGARNITYGFYGEPEKFMGVFIYFEGAAQYDWLETMLTDMYGDPEIEKIEENRRRLIWEGDIAGIVLEYSWTRDYKIYKKSFEIGSGGLRELEHYEMKRENSGTFIIFNTALYDKMFEETTQKAVEKLKRNFF